jgi:hypothetical protein
MTSSRPEIIDTATITKTEFGYEIVNSRENLVAHFRDWESLATLFRDADYSEEYIAARRAMADNEIKTGR